MSWVHSKSLVAKQCLKFSTWKWKHPFELVLPIFLDLMISTDAHFSVSWKLTSLIMIVKLTPVVNFSQLQAT